MNLGYLFYNAQMNETHSIIFTTKQVGLAYYISTTTTLCDYSRQRIRQLTQKLRTSWLHTYRLQ